MNSKNKQIIAVIGGDTRQVHLAEMLASDGFKVNVWALDRCRFSDRVRICCSAREACENASITALPMPIAREGAMLNCPLSSSSHELTEVFEAMGPESLGAAGSVNEEVRGLAFKHNIRLTDYIKREDLALSNAGITAEGAVQKAMELLPVTVNGCSSLIIGYGRIGRQTASKLRLLGAKTTASARSSADLALIASDGHIPIKTHMLENSLADFRLIINTVPAPILTGAKLRKIKENAVVIDLASPPGGVDFAAASELGIQTEWALSLPGKVAPETSGRIIKETILSVMEEEGIL